VFSIIVFIGLLFIMFSIGMMQLIIAAALPTIVIEIGGAALYSWVFSGYMLASIAVIPLFSKLADIYGKRKFLIVGMALFALGSLYGGFAPSMSHLVSARVIQGLGAGIITPVTLAMVSDLFPPEKRGKMIGAFAFVQLLSNLLSPSLGSFITKQMGWSWIFFLNLGMVILAIFLVSFGRVVQESRIDMKLKEIDIIGGFLFGGFCLLTVVLSNTVSNQGKLDFVGIVLLLVLIVAAAILMRVEQRHQNPIIKMEFLQTKIIRRSIISAMLSGAIMYGLAMILPLCGIIFSQQGLKLDETNTLLLFMLGLTSGLLIGSQLKKRGTIQVPKYLWITLSFSSMFLLFSVYSTSVTLFSLSLIIIGLCTGAIMVTFLINSQNAVQSEDRTVLSGLIQLSRYFGASVGVTLLTGILPEVTTIHGIEEFFGAFGLVVALCIIGTLNEILCGTRKPRLLKKCPF
jgi:MFS family permease